MTNRTVTFEHTVKVDVPDQSAAAALDAALDAALKAAMAETRVSVGTVIGLDIALVTGIKGTTRMPGYVTVTYGVRVSVPQDERTAASDMGYVNAVAAAGAQGFIATVLAQAAAYA